MYKPEDFDRLPNYEWQYRTTYYNNFNNQLINGYRQGLALYDYDTDVKNLYKNLDLKPIDTDTINFDQINERLDTNFYNRSAYEEGKEVAKGVVNGAIETINKNIGDPVERAVNRIIDYIKSLFTISSETLYILGGSTLLFFIVLKKF